MFLERPKGCCTYISEADILNKSGVDLRLGQGLLQQSVDHVVQLSILETTLTCFGQGCAQRKSDDYIIRVLLGTICFQLLAWSDSYGRIPQDVHGVEPAAGAGLEVAQK